MRAAEPTLPFAARARRARRISTTVGRAWLGLRKERWIERTLAPHDMPSRWRAQHRRNAEELYAAAVELQGLILKSAQWLGARPDLLPAPSVEVLARLQDRVPARPHAVIRRVVERELGRPLDAVFARFAKAPVASASLAQVHEGWLHDGRRVAVKVQYPEIATLVREDLRSLRLVLGALARVERDFDFAPLLDELGDSIPRELDFEQEGRAAERMARNLSARDDVRIPAVLWEWSTPRVLVMEYVEGIPLGDRTALEAAGIDPRGVARTLVEVFAEQLLVHGFFHADPHPGNLRVEAGGRLVLLDFGLTKALPADFHAAVLELAGALLLDRRERLGPALLRLGFETRSGRTEALGTIATLVADAAQEWRRSGRVDAASFERLRRELPERIRRDPIVRVPGHLVLVGRTLGLLSGQLTQLGADVDLLTTLGGLAAKPLARA